jgi:hypothetical protein
VRVGVGVGSARRRATLQGNAGWLVAALCCCFSDMIGRGRVKNGLEEDESVMASAANANKLLLLLLLLLLLPPPSSLQGRVLEAGVNGL